MGQVNLFFFVLISSSLVFGCGSLDTEFRELSPAKLNEANTLYGKGEYYRLMARGQDIRELGSDRLESMKKLVSKSIAKSKVCTGSYEVIDETFVSFEGGSGSIYIRCTD